MLTIFLFLLIQRSGVGFKHLFVILTVGISLIGCLLVKWSLPNQSFQIVLKDNFFFKQFLSNYFQLILFLHQEVLCVGISLRNQLAYLLIYDLCSSFGIWFVKIVFGGFGVVERKVSQLIIHPIYGHNTVRQLRHPFQIT